MSGGEFTPTLTARDFTIRLIRFYRALERHRRALGDLLEVTMERERENFGRWRQAT